MKIITSIHGHPKTPKTLYRIKKACAAYGEIPLSIICNFKNSRIPKIGVDDLAWLTDVQNSMGSEVQEERDALMHIFPSEDLRSFELG